VKIVNLKKIWMVRVLIGFVFFFNVQSAVQFLIRPEVYISAFELSGEVGEITLRGFGILFLMWNVPYFFALLQPVKNILALIEANLMQFIGLVGESILLITMDKTHWMLAGSIRRFVIFDGLGLVLLILAGWTAYRLRKYLPPIKAVKSGA